jgi:hypothetical protein
MANIPGPLRGALWWIVAAAALAAALGADLIFDPDPALGQAATPSASHLTLAGPLRS